MDRKFEQVPKDIEDGTWFPKLVRELGILDHIQKDLSFYERLSKINKPR